MEKFTKKFLFYFGSFIAVIVIAELVVFVYLKFNNNKSEKIDLTCVSEQTDEIVRGQSLSGVIEEGQTVKLLRNFYNCNPVQRGDIIAYNLSGRTEPIIKIVKGLPGDEFKLEQNQRGGYNIIINNKILTVSTGAPYELPAGRQKMLELYIHDYNGVIPPDAYLIFGNLSSGSLDSTRFGLVGKEGIAGKIHPVK
ncbi:signal peptidase I [Candidatus Falkowbacteria bacterium RIFOXYC2_FULL_47_12]|uniref:Signal peptidase I n=2 Tax=Candidatus Falkowiibacteriota TaxID=1752728 RepID=A0A1F5TLX7_9BACT|nr:MAG: signal peptidase I [Candidatus Falkowbacteria bacterium RIFOXYA2_FULL_47_9]OGF39807.1 MAG: signal peptidase I [Candidatus Falkowbacteria bacterium RIFOXYC2_FULL_47_12]